VPQELELATPENFDEEGYLLANPDIARHVANGGNARVHLERHGLREGRKQVAPDPAARLARKRARYARLAGVLDAASGAGGDFAPLGETGAFPLRYGEAPLSLDSYDAESANAGFGGGSRKASASTAAPQAARSSANDDRSAAKISGRA